MKPLIKGIFARISRNGQNLNTSFEDFKERLEEDFGFSYIFKKYTRSDLVFQVKFFNI